MLVRYALILFLCLSCYFGVAGTAQSQSSAENVRSIVRRVVPTYPEMAKRMNLKGTVKVLVVVAPDGTVKAVEPIGGSPVLIQAAQDALSKWKFSPASAESKELIELHFNPQ